MRRNSIYLRSKFSDKELSLLKLDLINNSIYFVSKIKGLILSQPIIEDIVKNSVNNVLSNYKFGKDGSLGDLVKLNVIANLKAYYENTCPDQVHEVIWPDLDKRKPFDKLLEVLQKVKMLPEEEIENIFEEANQMLNGRQQKLLFTIYNNSLVTYAEICKQFGTRGVMTYREIKIIYAQLLQTMKFLEIEI